MPTLNAFTGFPSAGFTFFEQLADNNNRDWFQAHKDVYERECRETMERLVFALGVDPSSAWIPRIYRDIRFSKDKSPYKTHIAAGVLGHYVHWSAEGVYVGTGFYKPDARALNRFREAVDDDKSGKALAQIVAKLRAKGYAVDTHERLTSTPRGYAADHPRIELLRMKDLHAGKTLERGPTTGSARALKEIKQVMSDAKPLAEWVKTHVRPGR